MTSFQAPLKIYGACALVYILNFTIFISGETSWISHRRYIYCLTACFLYKATPSGSGQGLSQVDRWEGGFTHYVIIPLNEHVHKSSCCNRVLFCLFVCLSISSMEKPMETLFKDVAIQSGILVASMPGHFRLKIFTDGSMELEIEAFINCGSKTV